jgi:hypothetical protein
VSASAASAAPGLAGQLNSSEDAPQRGAQAAPAAVERAPEAGSSVEAAVTLGEAAGATVALGSPDTLSALAPAAAEAVAVLAVEPPVAANTEMAEASLLGASEEGGAGPRPVPSSGSLVPARRGSEGRRQLLRFRTRGAPDPCRGNGGVAPVDLGGPSQGRSQDPPGNDFRHTFLVIKAFFVTPRFLPSGSDGSERRQVVVHPPRGRCLGFAAVPEDHACQGYRAPLPTERRGGGPSVALCRSGSRGSSGTRRGASAAVGA